MNPPDPIPDDLGGELRAAASQLTAIEAALEAFSATAAALLWLADMPPEKIVATEDSLEAIRRELARLAAVLGVPPALAPAPGGGAVIPFPTQQQEAHPC